MTETSGSVCPSTSYGPGKGRLPKTITQFSFFSFCILLFLFTSLQGTSKEILYYNASFTILHKEGNKKGTTQK